MVKNFRVKLSQKKTIRLLLLLPSRPIYLLRGEAEYPNLNRLICIFAEIFLKYKKLGIIKIN